MILKEVYVERLVGFALAVAENGNDNQFGGLTGGKCRDSVDGLKIAASGRRYS